MNDILFTRLAFNCLNIFYFVCSQSFSFISSWTLSLLCLAIDIMSYKNFRSPLVRNKECHFTKLKTIYEVVRPNSADSRSSLDSSSGALAFETISHRNMAASDVQSVGDPLSHPNKSRKKIEISIPSSYSQTELPPYTKETKDKTLSSGVTSEVKNSFFSWEGKRSSKQRVSFQDSITLLRSQSFYELRENGDEVVKNGVYKRGIGWIRHQTRSILKNTSCEDDPVLCTCKLHNEDRCTCKAVQRRESCVCKSRVTELCTCKDLVRRHSVPGSYWCGSPDPNNFLIISRLDPIPFDKRRRYKKGMMDKAIWNLKVIVWIKLLDFSHIMSEAEERGVLKICCLEIA